MRLLLYYHIPATCQTNGSALTKDSLQPVVPLPLTNKARTSSSRSFILYKLHTLSSSTRSDNSPWAKCDSKDPHGNLHRRAFLSLAELAGSSTAHFTLSIHDLELPSIDSFTIQVTPISHCVVRRPTVKEFEPRNLIPISLRITQPLYCVLTTNDNKQSH